MIYLLLLIVGPVLFGVLCGRFIRKRWMGRLLAIAVPWLSLLGVLLYNEYCVPYQGGGFSFWPIAQMIWGTAMAFLGGISCLLTQRLMRRD